VILAACGGPPDTSPPITVRDSAGIEIVELRSLQAPAEWTLAPEPTWVFADAPDDPLFRVVDVAVVAPNRVAITELSRSLVIVIDTDGRPIARGGVAGPGPAEFRRIASIVPGDSSSFGVVDAGDRTLTTWSMAGVLLEEVQLPDLGSSLMRVLPRRGGGHYLAYVGARSAEVADSVQRVSGPLVAWHNAIIDTVTVVPGTEFFRTPTTMGSPAYPGMSFLGGDGTGVWLGDTKRPQLELWADNGLGRLVRWNADAAPMTPDLLTEFVDSIMRAVEGQLPPEGLVLMRAEMSQFPTVEWLPYWDSMFVTCEGAVWISDAPNRWVVLDPEGRPIGAVTTPANFSVHDVAGDRVIGLHVDDLGVESVRAYAINR
jgi:hypothetical protein